MNQSQLETFLDSIKKMSNQELINQTRKAHAYMHFHPDSPRRELYELLTKKSWDKGYPLDAIIYHIPCYIENMSMWEVCYYMKDVLDISNIS